MTNEINSKQELDEDIFTASKDVQSEKRDRRNYFLFGLVFIVLLFIHYTKSYSFDAWLVVAFWVLALLGILASIGSDVSKAKNIHEKLVFRKNLLYGVGHKEKKSDSHFDSLVNINIENLAEYYRLVKIHTQKSFNASLMVALFGFILISLGLVLAFIYDEYEKIAYISTASGIIMEFISASFFYLYSKTVRQLKGYHDSLIDVQNMLLSFRLIDATEEKEHKVKLVEKMMDYLSSSKKA